MSSTNVLVFWKEATTCPNYRVPISCIKLLPYRICNLVQNIRNDVLIFCIIIRIFYVIIRKCSDIFYWDVIVFFVVLIFCIITRIFYVIISDIFCWDVRVFFVVLIFCVIIRKFYLDIRSWSCWLIWLISLLLIIAWLIKGHEVWRIWYIVRFCSIFSYIGSPKSRTTQSPYLMQSAAFPIAILVTIQRDENSKKKVIITLKPRSSQFYPEHCRTSVRR